ncbi:MAG TPA: DUF4062 domain-containing protein [Thermoanaerobaculia bacterium]
MPRPRIFISSTHHDLGHLRTSLERFVVSLGFDAVLSEKGRVAYIPGVPLDESCYDEVEETDLFVLIIGGRYGTQVSATKDSLPKTFYDGYVSITHREYDRAVERNIPSYILVARSVYAEYETYTKNKDNQSIAYAHVDSINVFRLIEYVRAQPQNNPMLAFDDFRDAESWLREQWAGLFRDLLSRSREQIRLASLQAQVTQLSELNQTMRRYLEEVVSQVSPKVSRQLIATETKRLEDARIEGLLINNDMGEFLLRSYSLSVAQIRELFERSASWEVFTELLLSLAPDEDMREVVEYWAGSESEPVESSYRQLRNLFETLQAFPELQHGPST